MGFISRMSILLRDPPMRAYLHEAGNEVYRGGGRSVSENAAAYLLDYVDSSPSLVGKYQFILAALWGNRSDRLIDMMGFSDIGEEKWPGNADIQGGE
ncbi:MAG: hypothetical protein HY518_04255 [Candidatus Aenigmarchaeota archaeon]|nr:hypothetical protein [Candidatus Aenigmarchaeota archaeon]